MAKILVTGATGFIGKRLVYSLLEQGHEVFALVRNRGAHFVQSDQLHLIYGDINSLGSFFPKIDAAYYLVHSMGSIVENLVDTEVEIAKKFVSFIEKTPAKHLIFLSGIIEDSHKLSPHLASRLAVEKVLLSSRVPITILRASIIIGSGSASFEIIRDLCEKLPFMIAPKWVLSYCQPIAIRDVLFYLTHVLFCTKAYNKTLDIGGKEAITFKQVLLRYASFRNLSRYIIEVPFFSPRLSSYWLVLITSVRFSICRYLVESMKYSTRRLNTEIDAIIPHECLSYEQALELAFQKIAQNEVISTWADAWNGQGPKNGIEVPQEGCLKNIQRQNILISYEKLTEKIWSIGGKTGWYSMNWAWHIRGLIDKLMGGKGLNRGRRHPTEVQTGDTIDFWRVILADKETGHMILYAEMKLPGEAWLEFRIDKENHRLIQTATFRPKGVLGRLYWALLLPLHYIIFKNMAKKICD
ncbi:MAG: hypothetical protein RLZZ453_21 [Chlamydiota bacterium]|jgi:uncharacterized protein YbjT (DUF2867 family)